MASAPAPDIGPAPAINRGLVVAKSNEQLSAEERAEDEAREKAAEQLNRVDQDELASFIDSAFQAAEQHRADTGITEELLESRRQRDGIYEAEHLEEIVARGGTTLFFNSTDTKCLAAMGWINEMHRPIAAKLGRTWSLEPTPIPALPQEFHAEVIQMVKDEFNKMREEGVVGAPGAPLGADAVVPLTRKFSDMVMQELIDAAKKRCDRMTQKIEDQLVEGGWKEAFAEFVYWVCTTPIAIIKGPVIKSKRRLKWVDGDLAVVNETIPTWESISPHDWFPGPNSSKVNGTYICELKKWEPAELAAMKGVDGWDADAIDQVLMERSMTATQTEITGEPERRTLEDQPSAEDSASPIDQPITGREFWGKVQGRLLKERGMKGIKDDNAFYNVNVIKADRHIVHRSMNADRLGRPPYYATTFEKVAGRIHGKSIPEKMRDIQQAVNSCMRNLLDNLALASGPQVMVDLDALDGSTNPTEMFPWKAWQYHGTKVTGGVDPIRFFQPEVNARVLTEVAEYFEAKADDRTMIPRFAHGNDDVSGAGNTASGLDMLMNAAAKGIRDVIAGIDREVIAPMIERIYEWNMLYLDDDEWENIKGDAQVAARGAIAILAKQQTQLRRQEFLDRTNNDIDYQIMGAERRANLLRAVAGELDLPAEDVVPSEDEMKDWAARQASIAAEGIGDENAELQATATNQAAGAPPAP